MTFRRNAARPRSRWRRLGDALGFILVAAIVVFAARQGGVLPDMGQTDAGRFTAIDGDSLRKDGQEYRLHAIDAPEFRQMCQQADGSDYPCGQEARRELARLIGSGPLACRVLETDRYQRFVAECRKGALNINEAMVRAGWAVAYRRHGRDYASAEAEARNNRRGIWQGRFETPEDWRNAHRQDFRRSGLMAETLPED